MSSAVADRCGAPTKTTGKPCRFTPGASCPHHERTTAKQNGTQPGPTLGPWVSAWIERYLVHSEGDYLGQPFRLRDWQRDFINDCYRLQEDGSRQYDRVVFGLPKGNGKTELAAGLGLAELAGPVVFNGWAADGRPARPKRRMSPDIPIAAASYEQAETLFGSARTMVEQGPLEPLLETFEKEIYPKEGSGTFYRVAAVAGTNDGARPTFFAADEVHEWEGKKERVHLVLSNGRAKRKNAWELSISTAGWDSESLLARLYKLGCDIETGLEEDPRFLMRWYEASDEWDIDDPDGRRAAIKEANPAAGDFLEIENIEARYHEIPEHEFRRYYLNQWTSVPEQWIDPESWQEAADPDREVPAGAKVTLGFDGSYNQDSTALMGCTIEDPHLFLVGLWERPDKAKRWKVPEEEVEAAILDACARYEVVSLPADDTFGRIWSKCLEGLAEKGVPVVEWPTRSPSRMSPACGQTWGALHRENGLTHDGSEALTTHVMNCRTKTDRYGPRIVKEHRGSEKHIDAAVAAVIAHDMAIRNENAPKTSWLLN